ncbi:AN1-type zinc finger protein 2A-like isoform X2 [Liolophura sinensis]|uniref:AN1-type zinc finger protein 2A-like isoform X2 n=1 Tax=Liolophura sinensis TaxID=3198878 RepID=UPI003158B4DD
MEFPDLGKHCSESRCKQLDFLPMKCNACAKIFCGDHIQYNSHNCTESYKKDNQVPVCPLCNTPIPVKAGELPDVRVGQHIDSDCQSDPAKERRKIYTNKCSHKGCKQKELVPVHCDKCRKNFCLKHRHELDHNCQGFEDSGRGMTSAGAAALFRSLTNKNKPSGSGGGSGSSTSAKRSDTRPQSSLLSSIGGDLNRSRQQRQASSRPASHTAQTLQNGMSEDEAMARALQLSMADSSRPAQPSQPSRPLSLQEQEDLQLAQALAASEQEARNVRARRAIKGSA